MPSKTDKTVRPHDPLRCYARDLVPGDVLIGWDEEAGIEGAHYEVASVSEPLDAFPGDAAQKVRRSRYQECVLVTFTDGSADYMPVGDRLILAR